MAVTGTYTVRDICLKGLKKAGVIAQDAQSAEAYETTTARDSLHVLLKSWQNADFRVFTLASQSVTLTTAASYTLSPVRPMSLETVRFKSDGRETPMIQMMRQEYDELPDKTVTGQPTQYYYDRQREAALLYVWPLLASASGETLEITYWREIEDVDALGEAIDMPAEWYRAVIYGLAADLCDDFEIENPKIEAKALMLLKEARGFDAEGSVFFGCHDA